MVKKLATLTTGEYEKLCSLDYGDLYSIHGGSSSNFISRSLEIFVGVNRYGKLYINVNFYPEGHATFDFDDLAKAIRWATKRVAVIEGTGEDGR